MKIKFIEIQNFRKLKSCRVEFSDRETLFVGANNSGKTSAMDALILFLGNKGKFTTRDFTLSNWKEINKIGDNWIKTKGKNTPELSVKQWVPFLPTMDVWLKVSTSEIHYVSNIIPTLNWKEGLLGVRFVFEPKDLVSLHGSFVKEYYSSYKASREVTARKSEEGNRDPFRLWPTSLKEFLEKKIDSHFAQKAYILNPEKIQAPGSEGVAKPQELPDGLLPIEQDPFKGLIKIDIINAQRGFADPNTENDGLSSGNLSTQLRKYYKRHLDPFDKPKDSDISALQAIDDAQSAFDIKLKESFSSSIKELENLNYPGFGNPRITISSKVNPIDGLDHSSSVLFDVLRDSKNEHETLHLPEKYNGLGYQNLISMVFKLISFRDEWMRIGKVEDLTDSNSQTGFEPLHLVLIEEPEAHLHAQVQQVFMRKAYEVLRKNPLLRDKKGKDIGDFSTQLVVSTHYLLLDI